MNFSSALIAAKNGKRIRRAGWHDKDLWVAQEPATEQTRMTHPFLYIEYAHCHHTYAGGCRVPWQPNQSDVLGTDWVVEGSG